MVELPSPAEIDAVEAPVFGLSYDYESGFRIPRHAHARAQLVYARSGVMTVGTDEGSWVVPSQRAVWVPGGVEHEIRMSGRVELRTLYLTGATGAGLPRRCAVIGVPPLLREIVLRLVDLGRAAPRESGRFEHLVAVLLDEMEATRVAPLHLPRPMDARARRVSDALERNPADARPLLQWSRRAGASARTLDRIFRRETGMAFGAWRQQLRLLRALEQLAAGSSVTRVALATGYDSTSAFIAMFRRSLGTTPGRYFREPRAGVASGTGTLA